MKRSCASFGPFPRHILLFGFAALSAVILMSSCSRQAPAGAGARRPGSGAPVPVLVAQAVARDIPIEIHAIGTVQPFSAVSVRPQITGKIIQVHFREGQDVKSGDLLFSLDARPWEAALNQTVANSKRDEAQLVSARLAFQRSSNLFESKIASQQDLDTAEAEFQALQATLLADNAAISNAQLNLGYMEIRSPIEGRTGDLTVKAGNVVKAPDDVLLRITQIHPVYVGFSVPERHLPEIRSEFSSTNLPVQAVVPSQTNHPAFGELTFIDNMVDTNTGTIFLKGTFPNTNNVLWPGQFVHVSLTLSNLTQATIVPSQAVQTGQNGEFVFLVKQDQTVDARPVATSVTYDGFTVVSSGVKPGETVVTDGQLRLVPGAKVNIKSAENGAATNAVAEDK